MGNNSVKNGSGLYVSERVGTLAFPYDKTRMFMDGVGKTIFVSAGKELDWRLIAVGINATITLKKEGESPAQYGYIVELKDPTADAYQDIIKYVDLPNVAVELEDALMSAINVIDVCLDNLEVKKFEERMWERKDVLRAGLELEVDTNKEGITTFSLYRELDNSPKIKLFAIETSDPFYQEKLMKAVEAFATRNLIRKIAKQHPEMPIVYHYDSCTFEVPWMLRVPFAKAQTKELYNRDLEDLDHGVEMALNMGPVPLTRKNLEILLKVMDTDTLKSKFH